MSSRRVVRDGAFAFMIATQVACARVSEKQMVSLLYEQARDFSISEATRPTTREAIEPYTLMSRFYPNYNPFLFVSYNQKRLR